MKLEIKKIIDFYIGGFLLLFLKQLVRLTGKGLKRDHDPIPKGDITIIKLLGGGSLVIALPAIYSIKETYPQFNLNIVTTKSIAPFAKTLNIFDNIYIIDDKNIFALLMSSFKIIKILFRTDTILDYEVYSRLTTIFAVLTCARNRIGFYREAVKDRAYFSTHLVFFNLYYGSWYFYEEITKLIGASILSYEDVREKFMQHYSSLTKENDYYKIGIGHACSDLSKERMLSPSEWKLAISHELNSSKSYEIYFWGTPKDAIKADKIIEKLQELPLNLRFKNQCGKTSLDQSIKELANMDEFFGIDSALLHYARLLGIKTNSFFGPTSPNSLLKPIDLDEKINYIQVPCSPCVHVTEKPPCNGNNICIKNLIKLEEQNEI